MKCPGVTKKAHPSPNPQGLPCTLIFNKMYQISVGDLAYFQALLVILFCSLLCTALRYLLVSSFLTYPPILTLLLHSTNPHGGYKRVFYEDLKIVEVIVAQSRR